ncbi:cupin domain-containing protein [archaeon]|nr:cupin domain-containing protein [archaeon]
MAEWIKKEQYDTKLLADEKALNSLGSEIQLVRFKAGKYEHYHKKKTEFFYVLKGNGRVVLGDEVKMVGVGDVILIKSGVRHTFINEDGLELIMLKTNNSKDDTFS